MNPILSIIIPCYNHGIYIQDALDSIEYATEKYSVEIIIVNDGSSEQATITKLEELKSKGYTILNQINSGLAKARNNGIKLAKGKYILPLDSDNKVLKPYLNDAIDVLEKNNQFDIVYGNAVYFGEKSGNWIVGEYNLLKFIPDNYIDACAIYRKSIWEKLEGYDEKMPSMGVEDWDFWLNASFSGYRFYYLDKFCFNYRFLSSSMIRTVDDSKTKSVKEYLFIKYKKYIDLPDLESYYGKKAILNNDFLIQNSTLTKLLKLILLKISLKFKKSFSK